MKILHTSDWHLGITLHNIPLYDQQEHFINSFLKIAENERPDAVIIAGDIFDSSISNSDAIHLYSAAVTELCLNLKIPAVVIAGNHDGAARLASCRGLLSQTGLHVTGRLTRPCEPVLIGDTAIYPVPYFNIDEVRALYADREIKTYEDAFSAVCDDIRSTADKSRKNIIAAHAFISGASLSDSDRSAMLGTAQMVSADVFDGFDFVALGHLHRPQSVRPNVCYSGSPLKYSVTEASSEKSVIMLDTDDMSVRRIPIEPLHEMRILKGTYESLTADAEESDDYIHIELTDMNAGLEIINLFRRYYPNLVSVRGTSSENGGGETTLTAESVESMSPSEILSSFFSEVYSSSADEELTALFEEALAACEEGGELE